MKLAIKNIEEQLYLGHIGGPCSYLPDRDSSLLFLDGRGVGRMYRLLLDAGYRRHGQHLYRPDCPGCRECRVLRIPVADFQPDRSQRRVARRGRAAFRIQLGRPEFMPEKLALYNKYLKHQHGRADGASDAIGETQYREFFIESLLGQGTFELNLFFEDRLVGVGILDQVGDALSAVYFFFEHAVGRLSPGTYAILAGMDIARERGLTYYYPGYFIAGCAAMNYKARFGPHQIRDIGGDRWVLRSAPSDSPVQKPAADPSQAPR